MIIGSPSTQISRIRPEDTLPREVLQPGISEEEKNSLVSLTAPDAQGMSRFIHNAKVSLDTDTDTYHRPILRS